MEDSGGAYKRNAFRNDVMLDNSVKEDKMNTGVQEMEVRGKMREEFEEEDWRERGKGGEEEKEGLREGREEENLSWHSRKRLHGCKNNLR